MGALQVETLLVRTAAQTRSSSSGDEALLFPHVSLFFVIEFSLSEVERKGERIHVCVVSEGKSKAATSTFYCKAEQEQRQNRS